MKSWPVVLATEICELMKITEIEWTILNANRLKLDESSKSWEGTSRGKREASRKCGVCVERGRKETH